MKLQTIVKLIVFMVITLVCAFITVNGFSGKFEEPKEQSFPQVVPKVSVMTVKPGVYRAALTFLGEVVPEWKNDIKSQVDGEITFFSPRLKTGKILEKGELLLKIENSRYVSMVANAELQLANAGISLLREQNEANEAKSNWDASGLTGMPASPLVLRKPQLEIAQKEVQASLATLGRAQKELSFTQIRAPFKSLVVKTHVNKGDTVFLGNELVTLYSIDRFFVPVNLSTDQWRMVPENLKSVRVSLVDHLENKTWKGMLSRKEKHLDRQSRLRKLYVEIKNPLGGKNPLYPGTFLTVHFEGKSMNHLYAIPETALTKTHTIWIVENNQLKSVKVTPMFRKSKDVYIFVKEVEVKPILIAKFSNTTFVDGLGVSPVNDKGEK